MAKPEWASVSPGTSGSGSPTGYTTSWTATARTGRSGRSGTASYKSGSLTRTLTINQLGATLFIEMTNPAGTATSGGGTSTYNIPSTSGTITLTGKSNAKKLTFSLANSQDTAGMLDITLPNTYTAGGVTTNNGVAITGDPGNEQEFAFSISFSVTANSTVGNLGRVVHIEGEGDNNETYTWDITIIQAAGEAYLWLGKVGDTTVSITIPAAGTPAQDVLVFSNTSWTIE